MVSLVTSVSMEVPVWEAYRVRVRVRVREEGRGGGSFCRHNCHPLATSSSSSY